MSFHAKFMSLFVLPAFLMGCSSIDIVSAEPDRIVIQADSARKLDNAGKKAQQYCDDVRKLAILERTEHGDRGVVAYFDCA